jgi:hypothetical protein
MLTFVPAKAAGKEQSEWLFTLSALAYTLFCLFNTLNQFSLTIHKDSLFPSRLDIMEICGLSSLTDKWRLRQSLSLIYQESETGTESCLYLGPIHKVKLDPGLLLTSHSKQQLIFYCLVENRPRVCLIIHVSASGNMIWYPVITN